MNLIASHVPTVAAMGVGAAGLLAGLAFAHISARDTLRKARTLMKVAIRYERAADATYGKICALTTPTMQVPAVQLLADPPTIARRARIALGVAIERLRPIPTTPDWAPGELVAAFAAAEADELLANGNDTTIPLALPTRPRAQAPTPPRVRVAPPMLARQRDWRLFGKGPEKIPLPTFPAPFRMPAQSRRPDPRMFANLPADPTRQFRVKVAA